MRPPRLIPNSPDIFEQLQHHLDLLWQTIEDQKGVGGKTIRLLGPLDMMGLPIQGIAPMQPARHYGSHQYGGSDEISVKDLSGLLADTQTPHLMAAATRGGAMLGDVFKLTSEVLTLALKSSYGLQKVDDGTGQDELALKKQLAVAAVASADASDLATVITLANEIKMQLNTIIDYLKEAEVIADYTGYWHEFYFATGYFNEKYFSHVT